MDMSMIVHNYDELRDYATGNNKKADRDAFAYPVGSVIVRGRNGLQVSRITRQVFKCARNAAVNGIVPEIAQGFFPRSGFGVISQMVAGNQGSGNVLVQ